MQKLDITDPIVSDDIILRQTISKLTALIEEDNEARVKQLARDNKIKASKLLIEILSGQSYEEIILVSNVSKGEEVQYPSILHINKNSARETLELESEFKYPMNGTWRDKIASVLKYENRAMTIKEIIAIIQPYHKESSLSSITNVVSNTINSKLLKDGDIKIYTPEIKTKGFYYSSPKWWDGDKLKDEHKPKPKESTLWK